MLLLRNLGRALGFVVLLAATADGGEIQCGGVGCENLRIRCRGTEPCYVAILREDDTHYVTVTHQPLGQGSWEGVMLDRVVNVSIHTGPGDDSIGLTKVGIAGNLRIYTGRGNDHVGTQDGAVVGHTRIDTGVGNDTVFFPTAIYGPVLVSTGRGDDYVAIGFFPPLASDDHKRFDGGAGDDSIALTVAPPLRPAMVKRFETVAPY
jgi:hypothetical protein